MRLNSIGRVTHSECVSCRFKSYSRCSSLLAQLAERHTLDVHVIGSSPIGAVLVLFASRQAVRHHTVNMDMRRFKSCLASVCDVNFAMKNIVAITVLVAFVQTGVNSCIAKALGRKDVMKMRLC